jgi:vacuolar-type H+-ATPase catalytic subunit A/Vma1
MNQRIEDTTLNLLNLIKKSFQKENMFAPCDVICHVTVAFCIYHFIGALTLYV